MGFGNDNRVVDIWYRKRFWLHKARNDNSDMSTTVVRIQCANNQILVLDPPYKSLQFTTFLRVYPHSRVHWGHARRHEKRSLERMTVERADYTQEMDCYYFDSWSVDTRNVCRSWLILMRQLNIVVFGIFATFTVPFRLVLSVEHEPEIAGPTAPATASTRHWQPGIFPLPWIKTVCFRYSDNRTTADSWKCSTTDHFTDLVSNRCMPTIFQSIVTTFVCTSTTFANAKWQSAGWSWWPVVPLFSRRYCEYSISKLYFISKLDPWCRSSNQCWW